MAAIRRYRVGETLKQLRMERKLSLEYVAFQANISHQQLSRIEQGQRLPKLVTLHRLDTILRMPDEVLVAFIRHACCFDHDTQEEAS